MSTRTHPMFKVRIPTETGWATRAFDIACAAAILAWFVLLLPALAIAIKVDSRGPVFYRQERVGQNRRRSFHPRLVDPVPAFGRRRTAACGRPFVMLKLRTMVAHSEVAGPCWAAAKDPRITRVGRILRMSRLDELPQAWNVLRGEMSLIGPRPERPALTNRFIQEVPGFEYRLAVRPGITGLAQVINGYDDSLDSVHRKLDLDLHYIQNRGMRTDMAILGQSVVVVMTGRGAR